MSRIGAEGGEARAVGEHGPAEAARVGELLEILDDLRVRVDYIGVQLALAEDELVERLPDQLALVQHASPTAAPALREAYDDALQNAERLRDGVERLLGDLQEAFDAVLSALPNV
jgi:hypothetical protein